ncbi:MAG: MFS transporter [Burkholderiales bacterium]
MSVSSPPAARPFFGAVVVRAAFVLALFGWGVGVYGPPVFLYAVMERTAWPLQLVSLAVTVHFLIGAVVVANLPALHRRFGLPATTLAGAVMASIGVLGWALAREPWQLFASALASGAGWVTMGAAAINAVIAPWYQRQRPTALSNAYNGASVGGLIFSPLWAALIGWFGFEVAALSVGLVLTATVALLARTVFAKTPESLGQLPDGDAAGAPTLVGVNLAAEPLPARRIWRDRRLATLAAGMAAGLFAQIGLLAHLYSLLVPALGAQAAGALMGLATAAAIAGRTLVARQMAPHADRRRVAACGYAVQLLGTLVLLLAGESQLWLIVCGVLLFGSGIGNAVSLPPLVAQTEFAAGELQRVLALVVAFSQATYSFAPALFGALLALSGGGEVRLGAGSAPYFAAVAAVQMIAIGCFLAGRRRG